MSWTIVKEKKRSFADESYFLKAVCSCAEGELVLEIVWAQIMYALTVELFPLKGDTELVYDSMIFYEDRVEIYGHKLMRITAKSTLSKLRRIDSMQKDGVMNYYLTEHHGVSFKSDLPSKPMSNNHRGLI